VTVQRSTAIGPEWLRRHPLPAPDHEGDKRARGQVLVVAGAREMPGAALLCAVGCLRAGAGRLQVATTATAAPLVASAVPEARVIALPETRGGALASAARARLDALAAEADTVVVGPGLLDAPVAARMLAGWLGALPAIPAIVDASALCALPYLERAAMDRTAALVLTPHAGEAARLVGEPREDVEADRLGYAVQIAERFEAICVMKGATTFVVSPGRGGPRGVLENSRGNVGLAMSGSGDTLAGIIAGLAARGTDPLHAAAWGVHLHAAAAEAIAARQGMLGFLARELLDEIPAIMNRLPMQRRAAARGRASGSMRGSR
jgi:hydroxyethylthiazole kinase-like uncharacterized protein yjeF